MKKFILLLITLLTLGSPLHVLAAESGLGTIEGTVINGTQSGSSVASLDITLKTYSKGAEISSTGTKTGSDGHFIFTNLLTDSEHSYVLLLTFQQVEYYSEELAFEEKEAIKTVELEVYEVTMGDTPIKIEMAHTIINAVQGNLQVTEFLLLANESDKVYIGSKQSTPAQSAVTLRLLLPKGATDLQYTGGLIEYSNEDNSVALIDVTPVLPGYKEITYSYKINYGSGKYAFVKDVVYPTAKYDLLVKGANVETYDNRLTKKEPFNMGGTSFEHLSGNDFAAADTIAAELSGLQKPLSQNPAIWISILVLFLIIVLTTVFAFRKRKLQPASPGIASDRTEQALLARLAQLDNDFESRKISGDLYQKKRAAVKEKLVRVMKGSSKRGAKG